MASSSSNRHWPSMFRSKHADSQPWQPQPDMSNSPPSLVSGSSTATGCSLKSSPFSSEERSTDPKPRWNPRPEQIRILEAIFNSGMVNPPRDEIPRIRMRLQEYGQVGDANVFYWFQNRKSRSKNKLRTAAGRGALSRACAPAREAAAQPFTPPPPPPQQVQPQQLLVSPVAPTYSSSSSSDRSSGSSKPVKPSAQSMSATAAMDLLSPLATACQQQMHYQGQPVAPAPAPAPSKLQELVATDEPIFLQWPQGHYLSAAELAAILGAQYMHAPVQEPPAASPAGMFLGHCNEVAAGPNITGHWSGLDQYWPSGDQLVLGKSSAASNTALARKETHEDATNLGLLQYGFGVSAPALDATSTAAALLPAASTDAAVTVASLAASTIANGVVANNQLQGPADVGFTGAAAAPTGTVAVARGAAAVCVAGTSTVYSIPAATHLDVTRIFGEAAVLFLCNGDRAEPVLVDEFGLTVEPLLEGAVYCVCVLI